MQPSFVSRCVCVCVCVCVSLMHSIFISLRCSQFYRPYFALALSCCSTRSHHRSGWILEECESLAWALAKAFPYACSHGLAFLPCTLLLWIWLFSFRHHRRLFDRSHSLMYRRICTTSSSNLWRTRCEPWLKSTRAAPFQRWLRFKRGGRGNEGVGGVEELKRVVSNEPDCKHLSLPISTLFYSFPLKYFCERMTSLFISHDCNAFFYRFALP